MYLPDLTGFRYQENTYSPPKEFVDWHQSKTAFAALTKFAYKNYTKDHTKNHVHVFDFLNMISSMPQKNSS